MIYLWINLSFLVKAFGVMESYVLYSYVGGEMLNCYLEKGKTNGAKKNSAFQMANIQMAIMEFFFGFFFCWDEEGVVDELQNIFL